MKRGIPPRAQVLIICLLAVLLMIILISFVSAGFFSDFLDKLTGTGHAVSDFDSNLVGYWNFDETSGTTATDSSGNGNTGTITGATWASGNVSGGLSFDGIDDYIDLGSDIIGTSATTICAWIMPISNGEGGLGRVLDNTATTIWLSYGPKITFWSSGSDPKTFSDNIAFGEWTHICITRDSLGVSNSYVNNVLSGTANQDSGTPQVGGNVIVGNSIYNSRTFNGTIDEVRIYDRVLTLAEISDVYNYDGASCVPECTGKVCGNDGCGGSCGTCNVTSSCSSGICVPQSSSCGNEIINSGEVCDGSNSNSQTCITQGFDSGTLVCNPDCLSFDTSGCTNTPIGNCIDNDLDGYNQSTSGCGIVDCDDVNFNINPGVTEGVSLCGNGVDEDCSGSDLSCSPSDWKYDWNVRTDRYGKPAGHYTINTPFPITEADAGSTYSIKNDENPSGKVFNIPSSSNIYFVDAVGIDSNFVDEGVGCTTSPTTYDPLTRRCDGVGIYTVYNTLASALGSVTAGHKLILVRAGTHDFSSQLRIVKGDSDTNRYMVIGYGQERPIIDGTSGPCQSAMTTEDADINSYITFQRLTFQNFPERVFYIGGYYNFPGGPNHGAFVNFIDLYVFNSWSKASCTSAPNGPFYLEETNDIWMYHVTVKRTIGHCIKIAEDDDRVLIEWTEVSECGIWDDMTEAQWIKTAHAMGYDFANGHSNSISLDNILRYSIVYDTKYQGIAINDGEENYNIHHNEIYDNFRCPEWANKFPGADEEPWNCVDSMIIPSAVMWYCEDVEHVSGNFYSNVIRWTITDMSDYDWSSSPQTQRAGELGFWDCTDFGVNNVYNNIIFAPRVTQGPSGLEARNVNIFHNDADMVINFYNNIFYSGTDNTDEVFRRADTSTINLKNNIFYQAGTGSIISGNVNTHENNLYYAPNNVGGIGITPSVTEINADPMFVNPGTNFYLQSTSPAIDNGANLGIPFNVDINGVSRPQGAGWDIGAYEYVSGGTPIHPADLDNSGCVDSNELGDYVNLWFAGTSGVTIELVAQAIDAGDGC